MTFQKWSPPTEFKIPDTQPPILLGGPIPESIPETKSREFTYVCCESCGAHTRLVDRNATLWCWDCYRAFFYSSAPVEELSEEKGEEKNESES